ncbi:MAG TPA: hypothetical protein VGO80_03200 [Solirubrobacteraceae bacterium]|jgi:hypothetical protein|nr:hypothetical protein [Solirubrobacteraceae bacterium]
MLLVINAVLYVAALTLSLCVVTPLPEGAARRVRLARMALALGGGSAITAAITLTFLGMWAESAVVGLLALAIVCVCLWVALSRSSSERDDGEDGSDGGGGRPRRPVPPAPPEPLGGPDLDWGEFDRARAGWTRDRTPVST